MSRPYVVVEAEQRSEEWRLARCGRLTASVAKHILSTGRGGGEAVGRRDLRIQLATERITGQPIEDGFQSDAMRRGAELEAEAIAAYEAHTGSLVQRVGFLAHIALPIGCSPDGMIDNAVGGAEIKAPKQATHLGYLLAKTLPEDYRPQILHSLLVTEADYWDFCSYDPRFPEPLQIFCIRTKRDDVDLKAYRLSVELFLGEVSKQESEVRALMVRAA